MHQKGLAKGMQTMQFFLTYNSGAEGKK